MEIFNPRLITTEERQPLNWASILKTSETARTTVEPQPEPGSDSLTDTQSQNNDHHFMNGYGQPFDFSNQQNQNQEQHFGSENQENHIPGIVDFQSGYGEPYKYPQEK